MNRGLSNDGPLPTPSQVLLARALSRAWWALLWERLWPRAVVVAVPVALFLIVSWAGLWSLLPPLGRAIGLVLFGLALVAGLYSLRGLALPTTAGSLRRVDAGSGLPHRPATAMTDRLAAGADDAAAQALWQAHVARATASARDLRAGLPHPGLAGRDPLAVRALLALLLVASFVGAGSERLQRITTAFDWRGAVAPANFRVDAWVTPPHYTGRAPVLLPGIRAGEPLRTSQTIAVPAGSLLVVRATGIALDLTAQGLTETVPQAAGEGETTRAAAGGEERRFAITETGFVTLRGVGGTVTWTFSAIPDLPPSIDLVRAPEPQERGAVQLTYRIEDDYGVTQAEAVLAPKSAPAAGEAARPLYDPPNFGLVMPQARTRNGVGQTTRDLSGHPWAGAEVVMTLVARDEGGNEGRSAAHELRLPQRSFSKPLARALIEQRRSLALDANARRRVQRALDALTMAPERFTPETAVYLGLRSIYWMLENARSDDDLRAVVDRLWNMAVFLEDGNMSDAAQALRAAQEALRQALERGASDEELKRLMDELRAALDKFMQALAEEMRRNPDMARPLDRNSRELRPQDLSRMLDRMEELARSGARDAARRMLDQMQAMLDNLQMARPGQQGQGDEDAMSSLDELGEMIRREQQLRDRTFRQGQDQRRQRGPRQRGQQGQQQQGQQGQDGEQGAGMSELRRDQQALREQLRRLLEEMRRRGQSGQQPGEGGTDPLGEAERSMGEAEGALGEGDADGAADAQGRAIEQMRRGAQNLAQQMQQGEGEGPGQPGRMGRQRAQQETDPLGRPLRGRDYGDDVTVRVPGEIDVQRARRILEELRRRFSDPQRPQLELDYLERLLRDF